MDQHESKAEYNIVKPNYGNYTTNTNTNTTAEAYQKSLPSLKERVPSVPEFGEAFDSTSKEVRTPSQARKTTTKGTTTTRHKRISSYPGTPGRNQFPVGYPSQGYTYGTSPYHSHSYESTEYSNSSNHYYPGMQVYNPWMGGYEMQWSAYGAYVMSNMMSRRSEMPTRVLFIGNIPSHIDEKKVVEIASKFGAVRGVDSSQREYSFGIFISYWDIRNAEQAAKGIPEELKTINSDDTQNHCTAYFMQPPVGISSMENQGVVAVTTTKDFSFDNLKELCSKFGEVKDGWNPTPAEDTKCIEFYDCRAAKEAVAQLKSQKYENLILSVEISTLPSADRFNYPSVSPINTPSSPTATYPLKMDDMTGRNNTDTETHANWNVQATSVQSQQQQHSPYAAAAWAHHQYNMNTHPHVHHHHAYSNLHHRTRSDIGGYSPNNTSPHESSLSSSGDEAYTPVENMWQSHYMNYHPNMHPHWTYPQPHHHHHPHAHAHHPSHVVSPHAHHPMYENMVSGVNVHQDGQFSHHHHHHHLHHHPSSSNGSNSSENTNWRQNRSRNGNDRNYDPSLFEFNLEEATSDSADARTTLMIRNIPNKYSQKMLLDVLNKRYKGKYDFFYLPIDFKNRCNLGYSFVNFIDPSTTAEFYKEFHTKSWEEFNSKKVCEITYARVQGRDKLIEHFKNSRFPCNDPDYLPLVFEVEKGSQRTVTKGTPVSHWATNQTQYPSNHSAVAAH